MWFCKIAIFLQVKNRIGKKEIPYGIGQFNRLINLLRNIAIYVRIYLCDKLLFKLKFAHKYHCHVSTYN